MEFIPKRFEQDRPQISPEAIDHAYTKAIKILSNPIDPVEFNYKDTEADIEHVKKMEALFARQNQNLSAENIRGMKIGKIFEAIVFEHAEQSNWFGEKATTIQTSKYDDIVNKVDTIVEFEDDETSASHLALAVDVTVAERFADKFAHIKKGIDQGELARIKYFKSDALNFKGEQTGIPHVVIGVDKRTIYDVIDAWMKKDNKKLAEHPVQIKILAQIKWQLEAYREYAVSIKQTGVVKSYTKALAIIDRIIAEKSITEAQLKEAEQDDTVFAIKMSAKHLKDRK